MKFKFSKNLEYQLEAINSIVDIFETGKNFTKEKDNFLINPSQIVGNVLELDENRISKNLKLIQEKNKIEFSDTEEDVFLALEDGNYLTTEKGEKIVLGKTKNLTDFTVEMETGTGKTYVYLRTIFELNKKYGLKKFIILVPSVAIREGVLKTLEQTKEHFKEIYNENYSYFAYDSDKLSQVRDFATAYNIVIMVMTIQSFNSDTNVMRQTPDRFYGDRPLDLIAQTKPVIIMDEPQNMESELSKSAINDLNALFRLRYSATHREIHNLVYRLSPVEAYKQGLVKKIQVYGVTYLDSNNLIFKLKDINIQNRSLIANVLLEVKKADGKYSYKTFNLKAGEDLYLKTKNDKYKDLFISDINKIENFVELSNGTQYKLEESENKIDLFRAQISETIKSHFIKQKNLGSEIKVLSLFFIDKVANYVNNGILLKIFEEEFEKYKKNYEFFKEKDVKKVHKGYFANKKVKGIIEYKDSTGRDSKEDKEAYNLIMKNKEQLLSMQEDVCFIFSHSALKEGWDNPNIFQICTLRETQSEMKKRQEIGRGLRLPLDVNGNRIYDEQTNILTVVANESYEEYTESLQTEFDDAGYSGNAPKPANMRERRTVKTTNFLKNDDFKKLWDIISQKTNFAIELDTNKVINNSVNEINKLNIGKLAITVSRVDISFNDNNKIKTTYIGDSVASMPKNEIKIDNATERITKETGLTRHTILEILNKINNLELIFENPEEFIRSVSLIILNEVNDLIINESIKYIPKSESWEITLFKEFDSYLNRLIESNKSPFDYIEFDSDGEKEFAESLESSTAVKVYTKLPRGFYIDTPLGEYRPDWAIVWSENGEDKLYFVRETKFGVNGINKDEVFRNLRDEEKKKILCGKKHFESIGVDFNIVVKKDLSDVK